MSDKKPSDATPEQLARLLAEGADPPQGAEPSPLAVGQRIDDFEILEEVGRGGMGVVYRAFELSLKRVVALKVLNREISSNVSALRRFRREATLAANLVHPNLIAVYHLSTHENPLYFTMEFVQGRSVKDKVEQFGFLPPAEAVRIIVQVCDALQYAHEHDIIHRDIKPSNILLQNHIERVRITDFGIAQDLSGTLADLTKTEGIAAGTLAFMSPEQNRGEAVDRRSDVYSLGMTLYYMLTGKVAYPARNRAQLAEMFRDVAPQPPSHLNPDVTPALDRIVMKMIAVDHNRRYPDCRSVMPDLNAMPAVGAIKAHRPVAGPAVRLDKRRIAAGAAVLAAVLVIGLLLWTMPWGSPRSPIVLQDNFDGTQLVGWQNLPIVRNQVDSEGHGQNPMPQIGGGVVRGIGQGYNFICPWMVKPARFGGKGEVWLHVRAKSGPSLMNQAGVHLLADDWRGDLQPEIGYQLLLYGEGARRLSVYRYDGTGSSTEIARFAVGPAMYAFHDYVVSRDAEGNWSAAMDGAPLPRGEKDRGSPVLTFRDATYRNFAHVGIHFNSVESAIDSLQLEFRRPGERRVADSSGSGTGGPTAQVGFQDDFNGNRDWAFNGDLANPNFAQYPGVDGWVNGPLSGVKRPDAHYFVNIADGEISGCGSGYGKEAESFVGVIHREIDFDGSRGFSLDFRAVSAANWPNSLTVYLLTDWKDGAKKVKHYAFRIYGESSNHTIDLLSTALDSLSDTLYRYKAGPLVNQVHTYTFTHSPDGAFELRIDGEKVQAFQPPRDRAYTRFNRIGVETARQGSKIDSIRLASLNLEPVPAPPSPDVPVRLPPGAKTCKGRIFAGDEGGGELKNPDGGWDGNLETYTEARSNGNRLKAITWETTEIHFIPRNARSIRFHAKVEHSHWQSHADVYVYNFANDEYDMKIGGEGAADGIQDQTVPLAPENVRNGEVRVRAVLFAKHSGQAYARYYESEVLYEGKEAAAPKPPSGEFSGLTDWQNRPIPRNMVDSEGRGKNPMPDFVNGSIRGIGTRYNFINPWMVRAANLDGARAVYVTIKGKSGPSLMNQAGVWLLDRSWEGDMKPAVGYNILVYGEGAKRLSVYRYNKDGSSIEVARFSVGAEIHNIHTYLVSRDGGGNWSATMEAAPLPRGEKDKGTPDLTFRDMTYTDFAFTGIHFNSRESQLDSVRFARD